MKMVSSRFFAWSLGTQRFRSVMDELLRACTPAAVASYPASSPAKGSVQLCSKLPGRAFFPFYFPARPPLLMRRAP